MDKDILKSKKWLLLWMIIVFSVLTFSFAVLIYNFFTLTDDGIDFSAIAPTDDEQTLPNNGGGLLTMLPQPTMSDIDALYYLKGDSTALKVIDDKSANIKNTNGSTQYGFDNIDILIQASAGDYYTLVFGVGPLDPPYGKPVLAGFPKPNDNVDWLGVFTIKQNKLKEYGEFCTSNERGVMVTAKKTGVKVFVEPKESSQAAGFVISFLGIGNTDLFTLFKVEIVGTDYASKTYRVLCHNIHLEYGDASIVDQAVLNEETGYYELNSPNESFNNGKILSKEIVEAMHDSGNKYLIHMRNHVDIFVDNISNATLDNGSVSLANDPSLNSTLNDKYCDVAGGAIITFSVNSGFINDSVMYALDLFYIAYIPGSQLSKWSDGQNVYCYLVDKSTLEIVEGSDKNLSCKIKDEILYVNTNPTNFDANNQMLLFSLEELTSD